MSSASGHRYDLPASRVLRRAAHHARALRAELIHRFPESPAGELESAARAMTASAVWLRLAEDRGLLPKKFWKEHLADPGPTLAGINAALGVALFDPKLYSQYEPPAEFLAAWDRELRLKKFWPPGMPLAVLAALAETLPFPERRPGFYHAPAAVVERLAGWALAPRERFGDDYTLVDPACGAGLFLLAALKGLVRAEEEALSRRPAHLFAPVVKRANGRTSLEPARKLELFTRHLFGVDADESALLAARRALALFILEGGSLLDRSSPPLPALFRNLRPGDSLVDRVVARQEDLFRGRGGRITPFPWSDPAEGFGDILGRGGFSAVLGNPPWNALKGRQRQPLYPAEVVDYLVERWGADSYRPSLFEVFLRRTLELLAEGGVQALAAPLKFLVSPQWAGLRRELLRRGEIIALRTGEPWPGVAAPTVGYGFKKTARPRKNYRIALSDAAGSSSSLSPAQFLKPGGHAGDADAEEEAILRQIETSGRRLGDFLESGVGLIARPGKLTTVRAGPTQLPVARGEHVHPYQRAGASYLEFTGRNLAGGTRKAEKLTRSPRVLVRKIGVRLAAAYDESRDLVEQSLYFLYLRDRRACRGYDLRYFLGLINSRLLSFYYRRRFVPEGGAGAQLKKAHLDRLPAPALRLKTPAGAAAHAALVAAVARRLSAGPEERVSAEAEIERLVAKLYGVGEADLGRLFRSGGGFPPAGEGGT